MARLKIYCFGAFYVTLDDTPLNFETEKARALLAYLALEPARPQRRQRLAGLLWSDMPEERALHNLRQTLSALRKTLQDETNPQPYLLIQRDSVQFNPQSDAWLDVTAFKQEIEQALRHYRRCPGAGDRSCRLNLRQLRRAAALFRGPFLDQLFLNSSPLFDEWASLEREALNQHAIEALTILADLYERVGDYARARQYANQIVALAPWDETSQAQVIRLLGMQGQWSAAQTQYRHLLRYLHEQIGVEPAAETQALFTAIRQGAAQNKPLPPPFQPTRQNLPLDAAPFVGREKELDALAAALAEPHNRLLTLHGPGGVGKTRLALQAAQEQLGVFQDGVFLIPLASATDAELIAAEIAEALEFTFFGGDAPAEQLIRFIENKHMLWVLDNLEQLLPLQAGSLIAQVLQRAPGIVMLVTSRQRLNLQEECLIPVQGLAYPQNGESASLESLDAVRLFLNRSQRIRPQFNLEHEVDRGAVASICQMLEGLPLGVELAAAALWTQSPAEIAGALRGNLRHLAAAAINPNERHSSLRAAFEASWTLLSAEEQRLLARLSVFRGGFEAEMAQQVVDAPAILLTALLDKSLLRREGAGRCEMHEAIRQFAVEKLAEHPAHLAAAQARHAQGYAAFLGRRLHPLKSAGQAQALAELALEWDNIRQAWSWLAANPDEAALTACAEPIFHFCSIRTRYREGIELFAQAACRLEHYPAVLAQVLTFQGALAFRLMDNSLAEAALSRALALFEHQDEPDGLALCLVFSSGLAARRKDLEHARMQSRQALALFEQTGDAWGQSYAWYQLGLMDSRAGRVNESQSALQTSLQLARLAGDQRRQIGPLNLLGDLACQFGAYTEAQPYFEESLAISRLLEDRFNTAQALINLGTAFQSAGEHARARGCYAESLAIAHEIGDAANESLALINLGELALAAQQYAESTACLKQALALAEEAGDEWAVLICWIALGDAALGQADLEAAGQYLAKAIPLAAESGEPALMLRALLHQGRLELQQGNTGKAVALLGLVVHHEAGYDEHRQAAREALARAGLPAGESISLEEAMQAELARVVSAG